MKRVNIFIMVKFFVLSLMLANPAFAQYIFKAPTPLPVCPPSCPPGQPSTPRPGSEGPSIQTPVGRTPSEVERLTKERDNALEQMRQKESELENWKNALENWKNANKSLTQRLDDARKRIKELEDEKRTRKTVDDLTDTIFIKPGAQVSSTQSPLDNIIPLGDEGALPSGFKTYIVDPRMFVIPEFYDLAKTEYERLGKFQEGLEAKIKELEGWRGNLNKYKQEFETIRAEAVSFALSDLLAAIPAAEVLERMAKVERYKRIIAPSAVGKFTTAYKGTVASLSLIDIFSTREDPERVKTVKMALRSAHNVREALLAIPISDLPDGEGKQWLKGMGKTFEVLTKVLPFALEQQRGTDPSASILEKIEPWANLAAEIGGIFNPPLKIGLAAKGVGERAATLVIISQATGSLSNALSRNWHAELYLKQKVEEVKDLRSEYEKAINAYESLHPDARGKGKRTSKE